MHASNSIAIHIGSTLVRFVLGIAGLVLAIIAPANGKTIHLRISVAAQTMDNFNNWTSVASWDDIQNFKNGNATRPVVDLVLELKALKAGALDFDFELVREIIYARAKQDVITGEADLTAETIWDNEIAANADRLLKTDPIIRTGEIMKGIYVLPNNETHFKLTTVNDLQNAVGAVVSTWETDLATLKSVPLKGIYEAASPEQAVLAVRRGQADFVLWEFSAFADMHITRGAVTLVPITGYKVGIAGSRSWIISRRTSNAEQILNALSAGIKILRENGTIERAYSESGFFNPKIANWKQLF